MEILLQIGIFFGVCLVGELVASVLPLPIPASIIGMILMFILLCTHILHPKHIEKKSDFLLSNMAFFFVPAGVGILEHYDSVKNVIFPLLAVCVITTVLTFAAASFTVRLTIALQKKAASHGVSDPDKSPKEAKQP